MRLDCPREDCRIQNRGTSSTLMGWTPTYDKYGRQLNSNPNTVKTHFHCLTCGEAWIRKTKSGVTTIERM
jgi:hypothetical protein